MSGETVGRPMEILLVEDNLQDAGSTMQALKQGDIQCRVSVVCDGEEAMAFLHQEEVFARAPRPDLILLDIGLPKKDGREVLAEIRGDDELKGVPVVVLTASSAHKVVLKGQGLHVDGYMTKPVSLDQFIEVVKSLRRSWMAEVILPQLD